MHSRISFVSEWQWSRQLPSDSTSSPKEQPAPLTSGSALARLGGIGIVLLSVAGAFLYLGGWFTPNALTPPRFADAFERVDGIYSGFRRNHCQRRVRQRFFRGQRPGKLVSRRPLSSELAACVSSAASRYPAAIPMCRRSRHGPWLGLLFWLPDGEEWRTAMINLPVFRSTPRRAFSTDWLRRNLTPRHTNPIRKKMAAFLASHPETVQAIKIIKESCQCRLVSITARTTVSMPSVSSTRAARRSPSAGRWCQYSRLKPRVRPDGPRRQELPFLCADREHPPASVAMALDHRSWATR